MYDGIDEDVVDFSEAMPTTIPLVNLTSIVLLSSPPPSNTVNGLKVQYVSFTPADVGVQAGYFRLSL